MSAAITCHLTIFWQLTLRFSWDGTVYCSVPRGPKFRSDSMRGPSKILSPSEYWTKAVFLECPGGPRQHAALCLGALNFGLTARGARAGFFIPLNTGPRLFFQNAPGAHARALLRAYWPQILVCQHTGRRPAVMTLYIHQGKRPQRDIAVQHHK